jgi:dTDP-4-amino-4,6-dideoxygalactose transaminase
MTRLEAQSKTREQNAAYLTKRLAEIPGIAPARMYEGCTRNAWHLYMFRYDSSQFSGLSRAQFLKALAAEGVPASGGYSPLNTQPFLEETFATRGFKAIYPVEALEGWRDRNRCPQNDRLCSEAVWLTQTMLLGPRRDMDDIADAVLKVRAHAAPLAKS